MALATQCPHCQTSFRVAKDQLKLVGGMVRCGACMKTFNGLENLLDADGARTPTPEAKPVHHPEPIPVAPVAPFTPDNKISDSLDFDEECGFAAIYGTEEKTSQAQLATEAPSAAIEFNQNNDAIAENTGIEDTQLNTEVAPAQDGPEQAEQAEQPLSIAVIQEIDGSAFEDKLEVKAQPDAEVTVLARTETETESTPQEAKPIQEESKKRASIAATPSTKNSPTNSGETTTAKKAPSIEILPKSKRKTTPSKWGNPNYYEQSDEEDEVTSDEPSFMLKAKQEQRYGKWKKIGLSFTVLLLLCGALAQTTYLLRDTIAARFPQSKPVLLSLCKTLRCQIQLPMQRDMWDIDGYELLVQNEEQHLYSLSLQLHNKANTLQAWPMLELKLSNQQKKIELQKIFTPKDYLTESSDPTTGINANGEASVKLFFIMKDGKPANYAIDWFYP